MALDFQLQQTPFKFGLAEGDSPHAVPFGVLTKCENYRWGKGSKLEKRAGTELLATGTTALRLVTRDDELCLIGNTASPTLYSYYSGTWRTIDGLPDAALTWSTLLNSAVGVQSSDSAVSAAGLLVQAWIGGDPWGVGSKVFYQVVDVATGAIVVPPVLLESPTEPTGIRVCVNGTTAGIFFRRVASPGPYEVRGYSLNLTTLTLSAGSTLFNDLTHPPGCSGAGWDVTSHGSGFLVAYVGPVNTITLNTYTTALAFVATGSSSEVAGCDICSIASDGTNIFLHYVQGVAIPRPVRFSVFDNTLTEVAGPTDIMTFGGTEETWWIGIEILSSTTAIAVSHVIDFSGSGNAGDRTMVHVLDVAGTVTSTSTRGQWQGIPLSRPFILGGRAWCMLCDRSVPYTSSFFPNNTMLVELETSTITPPAAPSAFVPPRYVGCSDLLIGGLWAKWAPLPGSGQYASRAYVNTPFLAEVPARLGENWLQSVRLCSVATSESLFPSGYWQASQTSREVYIAGATLTAYDGARVFDYGFPRGPWFVLYTPAAAGGGMATGDYIYSGIFEYRSASDVVHRSPPMSAITAAVTGPNGQVTLDVTGFNFTRKQNYRLSFAGDNATPTAFLPHRSLVNDSIVRKLGYPPLYNFTSVDSERASVSVVDTRADSNIGATTALSVRPVLYTTGGVKEDYAPVGSVALFEHADRLWVLAGDQLTWWYSKAFQDDLGTAPGFHPDFRIAFLEPQVGGLSMDDKAVFFSENGISYMLGTGPAANGQGSDFQGPIKVQTDLGCSSAKSIVGTPDGIMFQAVRGIMLLTRGLEVVWIGRAVQDLLAEFPNVTSAVLVPAFNEVRFTCNTSDSTSGVVLVYNFVEKQWSSSRYYDGTTRGCAIAHATLWRGAWVFVTPAGRLYREITTSSLDDGTYTSGILETAWVSAAGPLAFHSVRNFQLQGASNSKHELTVECAFDSSDEYQQSVTFDQTSAVTDVGPLEECKIAIGNRRKCMSIRFRITDSAPTGPGSLGDGKGPSFETMGIEFGVLKGDGMSARKKG
jgi:hypothetical protein